MSRKALAAVVEEFGKPLVLREFDIPKLNDGEVLIKVLACGICGSDVHIWEGQDARTNLPMILGHEAIGYIQELKGEKKDIFNTSIKEGDLVIWNRGVSCKNCYQCLINRKNYLCYNRWTYGISKSINDYPYLNGGYSSHIILTPETEIIKICNNEEAQQEDYIPFVSVCCAGTTTANTFEQIDVEVGSTVLIQGPGAIGAYCVAFAKENGASNIIVTGGTKKRLEICKEVGADYIINRHETNRKERLDIVMDITKGHGIDYVLEVAGVNQAIEEGLDYLAVGGTYASPGIAVDTGTIPVEWFRNVVRKNARIQGIWVGDIKNTWQSMLVYNKYSDILKKLVSHRYSLYKASDALFAMKNKEAIKAVITP